MEVVTPANTPSKTPAPRRQSASLDVGLGAQAVVAAIFEQSEVGMTVVDRDLRYTHANEAFGLFADEDPLEIVGKTIAEAIPELAPYIVPPTLEVLETGKPVIGCEVVDGDRDDVENARWFRSNRYPVFSPEGDVIGVTSMIVEVTDLARAHARLDEALSNERQSHEVLDAIFESAPVALALADRDLRYIRVNTMAAENWGIEPEQMVGRTADEAVHPDVSASITEATRAVLETGEPVMGQAIKSEVPRGSGCFKHWLSSRYPVRGADGEVVGVATIAADVTALRETEARLDETLTRERRERALLDLLFAKAPSGIAYYDRDLRYVRVNEAYAGLHGRKPEEYVGKTLRDMHPDLADAIEPEMREVLETGQPTLGTPSTIPLPEGQVRRFRTSRYPIHAEDGEVIGLGSISDDVTDLVDAEEHVRETLERERETHALLDTVFAQAPVGLSFVDRDLRFVRVNRAFAAFRDSTPEEIEGKSIAEAYPEIADQIESATRTVLETGKAIESQLVTGDLLDDSRGKRFFSSSRYPVVDSAGHVHGVAAIVVDVTDLKQAEELLSSENSRLETEAMTDALTGLPNRRLIEQHAKAAVAAARRSGRAVAVLYLDLDGFKAVNDTLGHAAGDALLREVAVRAERAGREGDVVGRIGGDEFLVLLPDVRLSDADIVAERVADRMVAKIGQPMDLDGHSCRIGVSVGISIFPRDAADERTLLELADASMYERKRSGDGSLVTLSRRSRRVA